MLTMGLVFLLVLNSGISAFNAWAAGVAWTESKVEGGWVHVMNWCAAIMSACGFTWVYLVVTALIVHATGYLPTVYVQKMLDLGMLCIVIPILGSGLAITIDSWAWAWRRRTFGSGALAAYNTYAQIHNTITVVRAMPSMLEGAGSLFKDLGDSDDDGKGKLAWLAILLAVLAVIGGCLTTAAIIRATARNHADSLLGRLRTART